jgi:hypothetical protein
VVQTLGGGDEEHRENFIQACRDPRIELYSSLTLLQQLRANEPDAWRTMVHLYTPLLYHWCARAVC